MRATRLPLLAALLTIAAPCEASFHTWQIEQLYSNADGTLQFVVLHESQGATAENFLTGHTLTARHANSSKVYTFDHDLGDAGNGYGGMGTSTANKRLLIATPGVAVASGVAPDYVIPNGFLPTDGGTLDYAGVDAVTFGSLPTDGAAALYRDGSARANSATDFAGKSGSVPVLPVRVVEFYNAQLDHYFVSALQPDIDALDSGRLQGWARTGKSFLVYPTQAAGGAGVNPVCRFYIPPPFGDSHFFSASPTECADTHAKFPQFSFESPAVFFVALPDTASGACPPGTVPVYRVWDNRADSNHRYTTDRATRDAMVTKGYVAEGYGPDLVIMCAAG